VSGFRPVCHAAHGPHMDRPRIPLAEDHAGSLDSRADWSSRNSMRSPRSGMGGRLLTAEHEIGPDGGHRHPDARATGSPRPRRFWRDVRARLSRSMAIPCLPGGGLVWAIKALIKALMKS
jgi:hypothetical protein